VVLALAEVLRAKKLREADDARALTRGLPHPGGCRREVRGRIGRAAHLHEADAELPGRGHGARVPGRGDGVNAAFLRAAARAPPLAPPPPGSRDPRRGGGARPRLRWLLPVGAALVTAVAFANAAPPAAVHDDKFFVPNVFRLDPASVLRLFSEDPWGAAGAPADRSSS
jgi:hypothetical protein